MANFLHDDQETLSLTDFPLAQYPDNDASTFKDHRNPSLSSSSSSSNSEELFEFFSDYSEDKMMYSHAEDIIFCGKLLTINQHLHLTQPPRQNEKHHRRDQHNQPLGCRRSRSESRSDVKTTTVGPLVRNSGSLGYKKLKRNSSMSSDISRDGSGKKSSSLRRHVLSFGLVNVRPPEMNIQDLKSRQLRMNTAKTSIASSESVDHVLPVSRKSSWKVLELLSCRSSSPAVMTPLGYMAKV